MDIEYKSILVKEEIPLVNTEELQPCAFVNVKKENQNESYDEKQEEKVQQEELQPFAFVNVEIENQNESYDELEAKDKQFELNPLASTSDTLIKQEVKTEEKGVDEIPDDVLELAINGSGGGSVVKEEVNEEEEREEAEELRGDSSVIMCNHTQIHLRKNECVQEYRKCIHCQQYLPYTVSRKQYHCHPCMKIYKSIHSLQYHLQHHTRPYKCDVCKKSYPKASRLKVHLRSHTGERPYTCDVCGKKFIERRTLKIHSRSHAGEKLTLAMCKKKV